jgi:thymidylate kinase
MYLENKKIIIAFDGPDNVGKGTQIQLLRKWLKHIPFVLTNLDRPHGENNNEKIHYGLNASKNHLEAKKIMLKHGLPQIVDRMHYTEYAYSILRGGHDIKTIINLEKEYIDLKENLFTIIFIDNVENISKRDDGKSVYKRDDYENIQKISDRFKEISKYSILDNVIIDIQGKDIQTVQKEVQIEILKKFPDILKKP